MGYRHISLALYWLISVKLSAQKLSFIPDHLIGHRSFTYFHNINYQLSQRWKVNNLTLFDSELKENRNNIFFIRNTLSYNFSKNIAANFGIGIKNPGSFLTLSGQYKYFNPKFTFSYSLGVTFQSGFTLEQSLSFEFILFQSKSLQLYTSALAIANINTREYQRGLQMIRLGVRIKSLSWGLALNMDQFNNRSGLENAGIFFKYNI